MDSSNRLEVRRIPRGSKCALSSSTSVVDGDTSAARRTHHAGDADRPLAVRDQQVVLGHPAFDVVEGDDAFPRVRAPDDDRATREQVQVERVQRLPDLEHRVVRRVHDGGDRPHPGGGEPRLDPERRGHGRDVLDEPREVPRASRSGPRPRPTRRLDGLLGGLGDRRVRAARAASRSPPRPLARCRARTGGRAGSSSISRSSTTSSSPNAAFDVRAGRGVRRQDQDPRVVGGDAELAGRAEHPVRDDAADLARRERLGQGRDPGARPRERDEVAGPHVPDADDDLALRAARRRSARGRACREFGWSRTSRTRATTTACQAVPRSLDRLDLGIPLPARSSASASGDRSIGQSSRSHDRTTLTPRPRTARGTGRRPRTRSRMSGIPKRIIVDALDSRRRRRTPCTARGRSRRSRAPSGGPCRRRSVSIHPLPHVRHPEPSADEAGDLDLTPGLDEREVGRRQPDLPLGTEQSRDRTSRASPSGPRTRSPRRPPGPRPDGRPACASRRSPRRRKTRPGTIDVHRRRLRLHRADLHGDVSVRRSSSGCPGTSRKSESFDRTGRVIGRDVQRLEVVPVVLDLGSLDDAVAHPREDVDDLGPRRS